MVLQQEANYSAANYRLTGFARNRADFCQKALL